MTILEPADVPIAGIPAPVIAGLILIIALSLFAFAMTRRLQVMLNGLPDPRFGDLWNRLTLTFIFGLGQARQPRYLVAGIIHILLFAGFIALSLRSLTLIGRGFSADFHLPFMAGAVGYFYEALKDYAVLTVLAVCVAAMIRRGFFRPARYEHPGGGKGHTGEAFIILGLVSGLMLTDMAFDGSALLAGPSEDTSAVMFPAGSLASLFMRNADIFTLNAVHIGAYWLHIALFFTLLNYLPLSKHFHVITAIPNVFLANLNHGAIKPVRWGVKDWMDLEECGVNRFKDFTWKHVLDFYSCADCGRCSDNCPAATVGRALSPKMISIKARDYAYEHFPIFGAWKGENESEKFVGQIITEDEIWACTTCGACERECPIFIEYIDKIVDMRRALVERGEVPASLLKPMQQIKKKGNAYGGAKSKRAAWVKDLDEIPLRELKPGDEADVLFFVDSCGSFDPRIQELSRAYARILHSAGVDFGILGQDETDSGNEIRRLGEEGLFEQVSGKNIEAFRSRRFREITAFDPHAFNAIKNDYPVDFPILHSSQMIARFLSQGRLRLDGGYLNNRLTTFHDPCYLGRHNGVYEDPRTVLRAIPDLFLVEMERNRSRSFCCSGGGLLLWYENEQEKERMGEVRVRMAAEAGAQVIITACPFCLINLEDAVKTTGNEGKIEVLDLVELVNKYTV